jgi:hypothetical protein
MGSMVDFPGFEAHLVDLPDPSEMSPHADARERLCGAEARRRCGQVIFWDGERWAPFATTSPRWTRELCAGPKASPLEYLPNEHICGFLLAVDQGWEPSPWRLRFVLLLALVWCCWFMGAALYTSTRRSLDGLCLLVARSDQAGG